MSGLENVGEIVRYVGKQITPKTLGEYVNGFLSTTFDSRINYGYFVSMVHMFSMEFGSRLRDSLRR